MDFSREWFFDLEKKLRAQGLDSDVQSFDEILENLRVRKIYSAEEFASHCIYVILAGGFSQSTAKKIHKKIMGFLYEFNPEFNSIIQIFNNKNKVKAICEIWRLRCALRDEYYTLTSLEERLCYLQKLPHIGKITANHLARNLGEDVVKYDIWIQRLGCVFSGKNMLINNGCLSPEVKSACDDMFAHLVRETGLPRGYVDVVLWRACQQKLISVGDCWYKPPVV